jgi:methyl-accepting chemotaxis protein
MKSLNRVVAGVLFVSCLVFVGSTIKADAASDWFNQLGQNIHHEVIKPTEKAFVQAGKAIDTEVIQPAGQAFAQAGREIDTHVIQPTGKAFVKLGQDIDKSVIKPIDFNVVKPIVGIGDTIGNIVSMAILIKSMIGPIKQTVAHITTQIDNLASIKNGKDIVDPVFDVLQELTTLPPHFQAILDKIAGSMSAIEDIVRPSSGRDADKIKQAAVSIESISASVDQMTRKIGQLNQMLHVRVKNMAESANEVTNEIIEIIK